MNNADQSNVSLEKNKLITKKCVWLVDDEPMNAQVFSTFLLHGGYQIKTFHSGKEVMEELSHPETLPDLLVVDVMMPQMSGIELTRLVRNIYSRQELPIVFLTANERLDDIIEGLEAGGNDYLVKPITRAELLARIRVHLHLADRNNILEDEKNRRTQHMRFLLDYVSQGLLTVNSTFKVDPECSASCYRLLGGSPVGQNITAVLSNNDPIQMEWMEPLVANLFLMNDLSQFNLYASLLPLEIERNGRILKISVQAIPDRFGKLDRLLFVFNDFTDQRNLEDQLEEEQQLLKMIVSVLSRARDYSELVNDYQRFVQIELPSLLTIDTEGESIDSVLARSVHTFKASFQQLNSYVLAPHLHQLESSIKKMSNESWLAWHDRVCGFDWLGPFVDEQNRMFRALPTHHWNVHKDAIPVNRETLLQLKQYILDYLPGNQALELVREVEKLYHQPFYKVFEGLTNTAEQQAKRLNKKVSDIDIVGGEWIIDVESWRDWGKSLIHVVRNQMDHGIELPEDRTKASKPELGHLTINIEQTESAIIVDMSDDGAGIDYEKLRKKILDKALLTSDRIAELPNDALHPFLFMDNFTTKEQVSEWSGRGVGLSKVLEETEHLGGTIDIISQKGKGTIFRFRFALNAI